ncbi:hypothetical protein Q7P37_010953 [Cladosporium fusiforme]
MKTLLAALAARGGASTYKQPTTLIHNTLFLSSRSPGRSKAVPTSATTQPRRPSPSLVAALPFIIKFLFCTIRIIQPKVCLGTATHSEPGLKTNHNSLHHTTHYIFRQPSQYCVHNNTRFDLDNATHSGSDLVTNHNSLHNKTHTTVSVSNPKLHRSNPRLNRVYQHNQLLPIATLQPFPRAITCCVHGTFQNSRQGTPKESAARYPAAQHNSRSPTSPRCALPCHAKTCKHNKPNIALYHRCDCFESTLPFPHHSTTQKPSPRLTSLPSLNSTKPELQLRCWFFKIPSRSASPPEWLPLLLLCIPLSQPNLPHTRCRLVQHDPPFRRHGQACAPSFHTNSARDCHKSAIPPSRVVARPTRLPSRAPSQAILLLPGHAWEFVLAHHERPYLLSTSTGAATIAALTINHPSNHEMASTDAIDLSELEEEIVQTQIIAHVANLSNDESLDLSEAADSTFDILKASLMAADISEEDAVALIVKCKSRADDYGTGDDGHTSGTKPSYKEKDWYVQCLSACVYPWIGTCMLTVPKVLAPKPPTVKCPQCGKKVPQGGLHSHTLISHPQFSLETPIPCQDATCNQYSATEKQEASHGGRVHNRKVKCPECGRLYAYNSIIVHRRDQHGVDRSRKRRHEYG